MTASSPAARRPRPDLWGPDPASAAVAVTVVVVLWAALKALSIMAWVVGPGEYGDTYYYFLTAQQAAQAGGIGQALREYPTPAALLLLAPYELGAQHWDSYRSAIMGMTTVADALFALLLGRRTGPTGVLAWVALTTLLGQLPLLRFDMLPAVVAGAVVLLAMEGRHVAAGVLVALGTGLKVWPIVLAPFVLDRRERRRSLRAVGALALTGVLLVALSLATGGWGRLLSPLGYQRDRGLQIEAVPATLPMTAWAQDPAYQVWYSSFHAYEVLGPTVPAWTALAQGASAVGAVLCTVLLVVWWRRGTDPRAIAWLALVVIGTFVVTSRALSPQYLLWLAAPAAILVGLALTDGPADAPPRGPALVTFAGLAVLCLLTTAIYPVYYGGITDRSGATPVTLALLAARNVGLLALVAWSAACALAASHGAGSRTPNSPAPRG